MTVTAQALRKAFSMAVGADDLRDGVQVADAQLDVRNCIGRIRLSPITPDFRDWTLVIYSRPERSGQGMSNDQVLVELNGNHRTVNPNNKVDLIRAIRDLIAKSLSETESRPSTELRTTTRTPRPSLAVRG